MIAEVIVNIGGRDLLDYLIPEGWEKDLPGRRVIVEIGRKEAQGIVKKVKDSSNFSGLKPILAIVDPSPVISRELLELHSFIADYYLAPLSRVVEISFPDYARIRRRKEIEIFIDQISRSLLAEHEREFLDQIEAKKLDYHRIMKDEKKSALFSNLEKNGFLKVRDSFETNDFSTGKFIIEHKNDPDRPFRQGSRIDRIFQLIRKEKQVLLDDLKHTDNYDPAVLRELSKKGIIEKRELSSQEAAVSEKVWLDKDKTELTGEQQDVLEEIRKETRPCLLFGVTGSGKTEIYIELMRECLKSGQSVLYMVPEIALVNQTAQRIKAKIGMEILHWHSNMTEKEKGITWQKLQTEKPHIILGARSSVFAPIRNLGLIIVDEEHETSYKQNEPEPRYNGVEAALKRAEAGGIKIVLGSATPSLERYYKGREGIYRILQLKNRPVNSSLPEVEIVDLKEEFKRGNRSVFSSLLQERIRRTLGKGEQAILFLNRRGYSRFIICRECGHVITCSKCSVPMILHRSPDILKCHYCERTARIPDRCPVCSSKFIKDMGTGTQKIESLLLEAFPGVRVTRLDQDQIKNRDSYESLLADFSRGRTDILLGTQMVVKGLDFSNVTLVGIISADLSLNVPDLYSAERTFQLLTQVSGRTGRGEKKGHVVIQTYNPDHFSITTAKKHDYEAFYEQEIKQRKIMNYPPYSQLIRILASGEDQEKTSAYIENLYHRFRNDFRDTEILGPGEAPISKIKNRYRFHMIIKTNDIFIHNYLRENYNKLKGEGQKKNIRILIDVDPYLIL